MNTYAVAHFSLMNGELKHTLVEAPSVYQAAVIVLQPEAGPDADDFVNNYPTYELIQEEYLPAVEEWLSILPVVE